MPKPAKVYMGLRSQLFATRPEALGITPSPELPRVWAALMEWWHDDVAVTLVCVADGTTSLYLGTGGGLLGAGQHPAVASAARNFLVATESALAQMQPVRRFLLLTQFPLPSPGHVRFYALTFGTTYTVERSEEALGRRQDDLWSLFYAGQKVLTQIRLLEEERSKG